MTQQVKWFEGRHVCHLCGARLRTLLPHKCRIPPVPFPPVKWCPKAFLPRPVAALRSPCPRPPSPDPRPASPGLISSNLPPTSRFFYQQVLNPTPLIGKKPINIKDFDGTPPGVRPVCPGDTSHLSRDMSRLSRDSVLLVLIYT